MPTRTLCSLVGYCKVCLLGFSGWDARKGFPCITEMRNATGSAVVICVRASTVLRMRALLTFSWVLIFLFFMWIYPAVVV